MPIVRKIIQVGKTSKAVIIPKSWLEFYERQEDSQIKTVAIEVNKVLTITPILEKKKLVVTNPLVVVGTEKDGA